AARTHVGVLVEALADGEPQAPERDVIGDLLASHRSEEDGVEAPQLLEAPFGDVVALAQVAIRAPVERLCLETEAAVAARERLEDLEPSRDDLHADPVSGDGSDAVGGHAAGILAQTDVAVSRAVDKTRTGWRSGKRSGADAPRAARDFRPPWVTRLTNITLSRW